MSMRSRVVLGAAFDWRIGDHRARWIGCGPEHDGRRFVAEGAPGRGGEPSCAGVALEDYLRRSATTKPTPAPSPAPIPPPERT
jgi:hypothetical protein